MGLPGFGPYARVRYLEEDRICQRVLFARLRMHLAGRTNTSGTNAVAVGELRRVPNDRVSRGERVALAVS